MILSKSKIYELRLIKDNFVDEKFKEIYLVNRHYKQCDPGMIRAAEEGHEKLVHFFKNRMNVAPPPTIF